MSLAVFFKDFAHVLGYLLFFPFTLSLFHFKNIFFFYPRKVDMFVRLIEFLRDEQNRSGPQILVTHQYSVIK